MVCSVLEQEARANSFLLTKCSRTESARMEEPFYRGLSTVNTTPKVTRSRLCRGRPTTMDK